MADDAYPDAWARKTASPLARSIVATAGRRCQVNHTGCTGTAVTTRATLRNDPPELHRAACQSCASS